MMKKLIFILCVMVMLGCAQAPKMVEGTTVSLGAYLPWDGQLYGLELISYVNGTVVKTPTNMCYEIQRKHSVTNDWVWGMMKSVETSDTTVRLK